MTITRFTTRLTRSAALAVLVALVPGLVIAQSVPPEAQVERSPAPISSGLSGSTWNVLSIGPTPTSLDQSVDFAPDSTIQVVTGCASYEGTYRTERETLIVEDLKRQLDSIVECSYGDQGQADLFRNVLASAESWAIDEGGLLIIASGAKYAGWRMILERVEVPAEALIDDVADATSQPSPAPSA
jgi:META domain